MKRNIFKALAALAALAFASCSNFNNDEQTDEITGTNAYVKISLADSSRTALPAVSNASEFTHFTLTGTTGTAGAAPISETKWETSGTETAYAKMTAANIAVTVGASYTFTLTAEKGGAKWQGSCTKTIVQGANTLSFALELASISTEGTGSLSVTLTVPSNVKAVDAVLKAFDESTALSPEGASLSFADGKATYTAGGIASGNYVLVFTLYGDTAKTLKLAGWREYAGIADGLTSSSSPVIAGNDELSGIYTITLKTNGGTLSGTETVPGSYTRFSGTITLPTASGISKTNYDFEGWYYTETETDENKVETIASGSTGNKTLYARWKPDANLSAANAVTAKINAIGTVAYTAECKTKIDAARTAYDALTDAQKALVSAETLAVLTNAESTYSTLEVNAVVTKINEIGTVEYTAASKAKIDAARAAYDALTDAQKLLVTNYSTLTTAESTYANLFPFKSFTIPAAGISKVGTDINATITADNFANFNVDLNKFTASCPAISGIMADAVFTKISDTEIRVAFRIPGRAGDYSITVSYDSNPSNTITGTFKVQDFSEYEVGNVLLNDGTIVRYDANQNFTGEQKSNAVCVLAYFNDYGVPVGLGLYNSYSRTNSGNYMWAKSGTTGYNTKFTGIVCTPSQTGSGAASTATFTGDTDGSDNWAYICSLDPEGSTDAATNYPAFDYVNKYAATFSLTGTYAAGWYMPSIAELCYIYRNKTTLNAVLEALGGTQMASDSYWSSSQTNYGSSCAWLLDFSAGTLYGYGYKTYALRVCCVRAFSN